MKNRKRNTKLIRRRLNAGLSQRRLASEAGISQPTVALAERGHLPLPSTQIAIAHVFDLDPLDLWPLSTQTREKVGSS